MSEQPHRALLAEVAADLGDVVARVAADVREPEASVRPAVTLIVNALLEADELTERGRAALAEDGARAALDGIPLPVLLDRYLSSGWVLLEAAAERPSRSTQGRASTEAVARLGAVLLKAGDTAAAALSEGYGRVERERAAQLATTRAGLLDALLSLAPADAAGAAQAARRAREAGLDPDLPRDLFAVAAGSGQGFAEPGANVEQALDELARQIAPPPRPERRGAIAEEPLMAVRREALIVLAARGSPAEQRIRRALSSLPSGGRWLAVRAAALSGLTAVAGAYVAATDALAAARAAGLAGEILDVDDLLLERAVLASGAVARAAVVHELGAIRAARGGPELVGTLRAYLENGQNLRATARVLDVATRTVSYRLARVERLLGRRLEGESWLRLAAALFADRLVGPGIDPRETR